MNGGTAQKGDKVMKVRGFTLIEVMVTLVIVGILSAIAVPSYFEYVRRANRAEMQAIMMEAAQYLQRFYTVNNAYDKDRNGKAFELPDSLKKSPRQGTARYRLTIDAQPHAYILTAVPVSGYKEPCGQFKMSNTGRKYLYGAQAGNTIQSCWR
ncbi:MAG: type IV pilin protein [Lautropia sp.]|nr:type IV pilin protein [Lautropia sp.]